MFNLKLLVNVLCKTSESFSNIIVICFVQIIPVSVVRKAQGMNHPRDATRLLLTKMFDQKKLASHSYQGSKSRPALDTHITRCIIGEFKTLNRPTKKFVLPFEIEFFGGR